MTKFVEVETVRRWLSVGREIAFLDIREEGQHGSGHPLLAVNLPYSRLETEIVRLVPRRSCRIVLLDGADDVAAKAARRLAQLGYADLHELAGGATAWSAAGNRLFPSSNVPSKAFAEIIEHECATPAISAAELDDLRRSGERVIVLDSRPVEEYARFHVPGAVTCPGAELVHRFSDLVPSPETLVVVSCAGRTRGIIGAQSLINAGVPNRVVSLSGGTQGWRLAGLEIESGATTRSRCGQRSSHRYGATPRRGGCRPIRGSAASTFALSRSGSARPIDGRPTFSMCGRPRSSIPVTSRDRSRHLAVSWYRRSIGGSEPAAPASCLSTTPSRARS